MTTNRPSKPPGSGRAEVAGLGLLFGAFYFIQGIGEPTEGLIAQPVKSLLKSWGHSATGITLFGFFLALPWMIKPLFGLLSDFFPILGSRRRSYLIVTTAATVLGLGYLILWPPPTGAVTFLLLVLMIPTVGVAFSDVVFDALMVERSQPLKITGLLQSVQWTALSAATILTGFLGGYLSQHGQQELGFLICAEATGISLILVILAVREPRRVDVAETLPLAASALGQTLKSPAVLGALAFIFLWNFNPFSSDVLYIHATTELKFDEQFYGNTKSLMAAAEIAACIAYGCYCRAISFGWLIHLSIATGVISTLAYWGLTGRTSAVVISLLVGFTYMTGVLVQLDLAARVCPPHVAGTVFATLMAVSNLSVTLSAVIGGKLYDLWTDAWGSRLAFNLLVGIGALFTAACWLLVPVLRRTGMGEKDGG